MLKANIIVHKSILSGVLDSLEKTGIMQIDPLETNLDEKTNNVLRSMDHPLELKDLAEMEIRLERLCDIFNCYFPEKTSMMDDIRSASKPLKRIEPFEFHDLISRTQRHLSVWEDKVLALNQGYLECTEELKTLAERKKQLELLLPVDISLDLLAEGPYTFVKVGTTPDPSHLYESMKNIALAIVKVYPTGLPDTPHVAVVAGLHEVMDETVSALRGKLFNELQLRDNSGSPSQLIKEIERSELSAHASRDEALEELKGIRNKYLKKTLIMLELISVERMKFEMHSSFGKTEHTIVISGWVEERKRSALERMLSKYRELFLDLQEPDLKKDNPPSSLAHSKYIRPFESLVTAFSPPKYNDLDPTPFVGMLFILFAGLMLGDAGYGAMILIASFWLGSKVKKGFMADMAYMGKLFGSVTLLMGLFTGSVFGDLIPRLFYGDPLKPLYTIPGLDFLPYDALRNPMPLFLFSLGVGMVAIYMSVIVSFVTHVKQGDYRKMLFEDIALLMMIPSLSALAAQLVGMTTLPDLIFHLSAAALISSILLLVIANKSMPLLALFEITGFIGDLLSFARILALGLATVALAMTWNIMAELLLPDWANIGMGIIRIILVIVLLIALNLFNFAFQALGACIHSLRLQYIEFFNRCYTGGGRFFQPFKAVRMYTTLEKDE